MFNYKIILLKMNLLTHELVIAIYAAMNIFDPDAFLIMNMPHFRTIYDYP